MNVLVQNLDSRLYLAPKGGWVKLDQRPLVFANAVEAISFCIQRSFRMIRLVNNAGSHGETYLYPFGDDPLVKAERKKLRKLLAESRRLKQQKRSSWLAWTCFKPKPKNAAKACHLSAIPWRTINSSAPAQFRLLKA